LALDFWWHGMSSAVEGRCKSCEDCAQRNHDPTELHSLPAQGLFYSWGLDLMGPFPTTDRGNGYIMLVVVYLTRFIVAVPIPNKKADMLDYNFRQQVLGVYDAPSIVVTDQGNEFRKEFHDLRTLY
jgi:hypothetical protein